MEHDIPRTALLSGNEAVARSAWECGVEVAAAYPGTPSTEILEAISGYGEIDSQWSVNEKVAYEVAYAAAVGGKRSLFAAKHVGINVAMDPLMTSAYMGVNGGFVVISSDDPGLHSSQNEQDNRLVAKFAKMPLIEPSSPPESKEFLKEAYRISEEFDVPVFFRMTTRVAHSKEDVRLEPRVPVPARGFTVNIPKYVMVPRNAFFRHIDLEERLRRLAAFSETQLAEPHRGGGFPDRLHHRFGLLPLRERDVSRRIGPQARDAVAVPGGTGPEVRGGGEGALRGRGARAVPRGAGAAAGLRPKVKDRSFLVGELRPELVVDIVEGRPRPAPKEAPARKPSLCPGCPHGQAYAILADLGVTVSGDIGCYTLGALPPYGSLHTCVCMGGSITFFQGMPKATGQRTVAVIGDSTFVHTGIPGLINAAYNGAKGLILILDNDTTAMTGNQPHPGTGFTIKGTETRKLVLEDVCRACGADNVDVVNPYQKEAFAELIRKRVGEDALSVIIARAPCRLIVKRQARERQEQEVSAAAEASAVKVECVEGEA